MTYQFDFSALLPYWREFAEGVWLTLQLSAVSTVFGFIGGALCAIARTDGAPWLKRLVGAYVEAIRNTPLLVQIFLIYFGIAVLGIRVDANLAAVIALVVNVVAYTCEIMRAGIESVHKAQIEAAECLGLSRAQTYWHVVLRPAIERVYPALVSQYVLLMLASSITSQISAEELTAVANRIQSDTFRSFETYIVVGLLYLALSFVVRWAFWGFGMLVFTRRRKLGTAL
ncbi:amino acid ABC transporter permease [Roseomonas gilardii]|uniref:ABC transporter permease n=1 Tax=Roseomonas gilardii TaxID=257708 RepID=A0A1L7AB29_9PROT|nr:amino acid ABC transporter permease [Roseomonas gilardii]APT55920.1 ABC transporter permease [Roseomonas gilardii]MDT8330430.1 amino acid ABC transporter permease [Roseomonas gilardii]PZP45788.1 MAG: amino acid ABC transporter permease [Azospirillum brasilense]SUE42577.1 Glutamine transport system permease protein glnP [Roseomonas gilardii subsp. rosea]